MTSDDASLQSNGDPSFMIDSEWFELLRRNLEQIAVQSNANTTNSKMMMMRFVFVLLLIATVASARRRSNCSPPQFNRIKNKIKSAIRRRRDRKRWSGRLLRAGFHDCLPKSCDGSIQHELRRGENKGIDSTLALLKREIRGTCCSLADAIKIGMVLSMELSGGPRFECRLGTKSTATRPNPKNRMPQPFHGRRTLMRKFPGFTQREVLAGNFGGHSLGRFDASPFRRIKLGLPFTPTEDKFNNRFARFMVDRLFRAVTIILPNWNNLPSDRALSKRRSDRRIVQRYMRREHELRRDFVSFMNKLCAR